MFERTWTVGLANNSGPDVFDIELNLPGGNRTYAIEAWISNFGSSNVHLIRGNVTEAQAADLIERGLSDVIMTLPSGSPGRCLLPNDTGEITMFFEAANTSGQFQLVTVRVVAA